MSKPLVSCIMPTAHRGDLLFRAIGLFFAQTYTPKELIVLDNSIEPVPAIALGALPIGYFHTAHGQNLGILRNKCCELARGDIIAHFDDDDWSSPDRLAHQVDMLLGSPNHRVSAYDSMYFADERAGGAVWKYHGYSGYAIGTSMVYERSLWRERPFLDVMIGEDSHWMSGMSEDGRTQLHEPLEAISADACDPLRMVARMHARSTSVRPVELFRRALNAGKLVIEPWSAVEDAAIADHVRSLLA